MNPIILLDIIELSLREIDGSSGKLNIKTLYKKYSSGQTLCKIPIDYKSFKLYMRYAFPVRRNNKRNRIYFKISAKKAYETVDAHGFRLRPIEHIKGIT